MKLRITAGKVTLHAELHDTPTAQALAAALPFGRTPISTDQRPKLASRCNVLGAIIGDAKALAAIKPGVKLRVEKA